MSLRSSFQGTPGTSFLAYSLPFILRLRAHLVQRKQKQKAVLLEVQSCSKWTTNRVTSVRKRPPEAALQNCGVTPRPGFFGFCSSLQMADSYPFAFILEGVPSASQIWPDSSSHPLSSQVQVSAGAAPSAGTTTSRDWLHIPRVSAPPAPSHPHPLPFPFRAAPTVLCLPNYQPPGPSCSQLHPQHAASHHPLKGVGHPNITPAHHPPEQEDPSPSPGTTCKRALLQQARVALSAESPAMNQRLGGQGAAAKKGQWLHSGASKGGNWHTHGCPT